MPECVCVYLIVVKCTLRKSGVIELGPLEENSAITGATDFWMTVLLAYILIAGSLHIQDQSVN